MRKIIINIKCYLNNKLSKNIQLSCGDLLRMFILTQAKNIIFMNGNKKEVVLLH